MVFAFGIFSSGPCAHSSAELVIRSRVCKLLPSMACRGLATLGAFHRYLQWQGLQVIPG